ncbi:MAG: DUF3929 family protein [Ectobacillus sp.]
MGYRMYYMIYHLENGKKIQDRKEFFYRDRNKMLQRVVGNIMNNERVAAIDGTGSIIFIPCEEIVRVELNHLI